MVTVEATVDVDVSENVKVVDAGTAGTVEVEVKVDVTMTVVTRGGRVTVMVLPTTMISLMYLTWTVLVPENSQ